MKEIEDAAVTRIIIKVETTRGVTKASVIAKIMEIAFEVFRRKTCKSPYATANCKASKINPNPIIFNQ